MLPDPPPSCNAGVRRTSGSHNVLAVDVVEPGMVLTKIVHAVVVAIRRSHHGVNMRARRLVTVKCVALPRWAAVNE